MQSYKVGTWIVLAVKNTCLTPDPCTSPFSLVSSEFKCCFYFSLDGARFSGRRCQVSISLWSHEMLQGLGGSSCWETNTGRKDEPTRVYLPSGSARWTTWKIYDPPVLYALFSLREGRVGVGRQVERGRAAIFKTVILRSSYQTGVFLVRGLVMILFSWKNSSLSRQLHPARQDGST